MLSQLEKDAKRLEQGISKAAKAGDKATMKKLQRELNSTRKTMEQLKGTAFNVDNVLRRLDKASPKELNRTLKSLQQQLNGIQRGSAAWDAHVAKIKAVKAELQRVNATMQTQKSLWSRFNNWLNNCQTAILGLGAAITGLVMAGRKAVNAFAEMDEQLANTRKYTGLSVEATKEINEIFKKMDTRTPREKLNELAQEAGRLGKNTLESVQGYVEAADIINVALVDLGSGATQTIAKLTNIFGVEELLGTKEAMLAVGSTVNVLSQNCTASKPYLVEFAQRMAGIGSQAGLTIPQILAFGAVLDANGQKVEMSATAIQKVIMNLANKNKEFAATLGLDAQKLNETLKHSAKDGLLMFLEALQKMGQDVGFENATMTLAPAFKEMGLDAARVSQVLSTLAMHLDEVKWQMGEADKAFNEASSATKEYEIFNNTAQAAIDKARKRVGELAIELGEKLYPLMKHIYTSSGVFLRVLNQLVDFFIEYKREIMLLCISIAAYTVVAKGSMVATKAWNLVTSAATAITKGAKIAVMALRIGYLQLTNQISKAEAMTKLFNRTTKASPWGIIIALVATAAGAVYSFYERMKDAREEAERARKEMEEWKQSLTDLDAASAEYSSKEITRLKALYNEATNESIATDKRRAAAEKLQNLYPDYFKNLSIEQIMVGQAKQQYDNLTASIINAARARAAAAKIEENEKLLLELEGKQTTLQQTQQTQQGTVNQRQSELDAVHARNDRDIQSAALGDSREMKSNNVQRKIQEIYTAQDNLKAAKTALATTTAELNTVNSQIDSLNAANQQLAEKYQISAQTFLVPDTPDFPTVPPGGGGGGGGGSTETTDKFAKEKEWREQQEALARIAYAKGETDYITYTKRMDEIAVQFYSKQLEHTDLTETERLSFDAQYWEAKKKGQQDLTKFTAEEMEAAYNDEVAKAKQHYIDGEYSYDTYTEVLERLELTHLATMAAFYDEGTKERLQAETDLQNAMIAQRQKHQQALEAQEAKYAAMKKDYFGDNPQEAQAKLDADLAVLQVVYDREIAAAGDNAAEKLRIEEAFEKAKLALKKKYGLLAEEDTRNAMERGIANSVDWLNSDGGKAITGSLDTLVSGMSAVFSQLSSLMQAELEIQTAAINKRYDAEISRAEGNSYKVKKLEKQKEAEIAKAKNEANRKMFAMQVIQAVAQTATNALNAYGSAAAIPVVGYILAPIAAAMAVAAGAIQIAAIKKQQQASEAQGYAEGGFTPPGGKYEEAGVVHKGEWVASQRLVNNPRTRPLLEALDYAQRTNTIGSITAADVSRTITAPAVLAAQPSAPTIVNNTYNSTPASDNSELTSTIRALKDRLDEPFVTVNTVTGEHGIQHAQDEYDKLMRNKSPKSQK